MTISIIDHHYIYMYKEKYALTGQKSEFSAIYSPIWGFLADMVIINKRASLACCPTLPSRCMYGIKSEKIRNLVGPWFVLALKKLSRITVSCDIQTQSWWRTSTKRLSTSLVLLPSAQRYRSLKSGCMMALWIKRSCWDWLMSCSKILNCSHFNLSPLLEL